VSAGPELPQAAAHRVAGRFGSPEVTLEVGSPRGEPVRAVYAAAHVASGNPPNPAVRYHIDVSTDRGRTWADGNAGLAEPSVLSLAVSAEFTTLRSVRAICFPELENRCIVP